MRTSLLSFGIVTLLLAGCATTLPPSSEEGADTNPPVRGITFAETEFDFGIIKQSGGKVRHDFAFTYDGEGPVAITGVPTSCACTSATVDRTALSPGDTGVLTVTFNPNLHEEPEGKFFKTAMLITDPPLSTEPEVKIWAQIDLDLGPEAFELGENHKEDGDEEEEPTYQTVMPERFAEMLKEKDFFLVDVHIPEQEHIAGTDLFVPYNEIEENIDKLPQDKNAKIVLYCRSGAMSRAAAALLVEQGYTNVVDVVGGKDAYDKLSQSQEISGAVQVQYIEAEARVVRAADFSELNQQFGGSVPQDIFASGETVMLLSLSNHQENLATYDYGNLASLDGMQAKKWLPLSDASGGHHVAGFLVFPATQTPRVLTVSKMAVGDIVIPLSPRLP